MKITKRQLRRIIREAAGKIICPNCGHHNSAGVDKCSKCNHPRDEGNWKEVSKEEKSRIVNEIQRTSDPRQQTLNQSEVDRVDAMTKTLDKMFFEYRKIESIPPEWLDDGNKFGESRYEKLEQMLMDASEEMSDLAYDMKKRGV